jgi:hypothetical protein
VKRLQGQILVLLIGLFLAGPLMAGEKTRIHIQDMDINLVDDIYQIQGKIEIDLKDPLLGALNSGVALEFVINYEIVRSRGWWFDKQIAEVSQRYQISYHALSRQYLLTNLNTRTVDTFYSLARLEEVLGDVSDFPLLDAALLRPKKIYRIRMRAYFDYDELPIPLRMRAYSSSAWRPDSGWLVWPLR